jgi:cephalosporin hydroxylase
VDEQFLRRNAKRIADMANDLKLRELTRDWLVAASHHEYSYHFNWLGVPIIQFPQDIVALQELIWAVEPDVIVETGIARGGSLVFHASMMELLGGDGHVIGIDVDIRPHARGDLDRHSLARRITTIEGSSTDPEVVAHVNQLVTAGKRSRPLVILDSNHTHDHVLAELRAYGPLVAPGSYIVVLDTIIDQLPPELIGERPWTSEANPMTAVQEFLAEDDRFVADPTFEHRTLITVAPGGFLRRVRAT